MPPGSERSLDVSQGVRNASGKRTRNAMSMRKPFGLILFLAASFVLAAADAAGGAGRDVQADAFGLYDVIGNVWEWTEDCFHPSYDGAPANGAEWLGGDCSRRIARGGSWASPARHVTAAFRDPDLATYRSSYLGFRVARDR